MSTKELVLLDKTKEHVEKEFGMKFEEIKKADLGELEKKIESRPGFNTTPSKDIYQRVRGNTYMGMGRILTKSNYEESAKQLLKKYL
jgi:hypothetical protein